MSLKVLVVDDEPLARMRLRDLLSDCDEPVTELVGEAAHAQQALDTLGTTRCDVVLLDIHMPGMDGLRLAQADGSFDALFFSMPGFQYGYSLLRDAQQQVVEKEPDEQTEIQAQQRMGQLVVGPERRGLPAGRHVFADLQRGALVEAGLPAGHGDRGRR